MEKTFLSDNFWFGPKLEGISTPSLQLRRWGYDNRLISRNRSNLDTDKDGVSKTSRALSPLFKSFDQLTLGRKERNMIDKPNRMENLRKVCPQVWFSKASMTLIAEIRKWARDRDFFFGGAAWETKRDNRKFRWLFFLFDLVNNFQV